MNTARPVSPPRTRKSQPGTSPLVRSSASARREKAVLRRARERIRDQPRIDSEVVRTTLVPRRTARV